MSRLMMISVVLLLVVIAAVNADKFIVISTCGSSVQDGGFNEMAYDGLQATKDKGVLDIEFAFLDCPDEAELIAQNPDHIILLGFDASISYVGALAKKYPAIRFSSIDHSPSDLSSYSNVQAAIFSEDNAAYVVGALAGLQTTTKNIGGIFGVPFPVLKRFRNGFINGVYSSCPDCVVHSQYVFTFNDPNITADIASYQIEKKNVDVLFAAAGSSGIGALKRASDLGKWVLGVDSDQYVTVFNSNSSRIISSALKRVDIAVTRIVEDHFKGIFATGRTINFDYSNQGVGLAPCHEACSLLKPGVWDKVQAVEQNLFSGLISTGVEPSTGQLQLDNFFDPDLKGNAWTRARSFGELPPPTQGMAGDALDISGDVTYMFFGGITGGDTSSTLWEFNAASMSWREHSLENLVVGDNGEVPIARSSATFTSYYTGPQDNAPPTLVLFGGITNLGERLADAWVFEYSSVQQILEKWTKLPEGPVGRDGHAAATCETDGVIIFGGTGVDSVLRNDLWKIKGTTWTELCVSSACSSTKPAPRRDHTLTRHDGKFYLHGGFDSSKIALSDLWVYDEEADKWTQLESAPLGRARHAGSVLKVKPPSADRTDAIVFTGGLLGQGVSEKDRLATVYYVFETSSWLLVSPFTPSNECAALSVEDPQLQRERGVPVTYSPRFAHESFAIPSLNDDANEKLFVFGGVDTNSPSLLLDLQVYHPSENDVLEDKQYAGFITYVAYAFFGINSFLAVVYFLWTIYNRKNSIVRASQFEFLTMIAFGMFVSSATIVPLTIDDSNDDQGLAREGNYAPANIACMASVWLYTGGFVLTFAPLFAKMWRVQRLFNNTKLKRITISNRQLLIIVFSLLLVDWGLVALWTFTAPLRYERTVTNFDVNGNPTKSVGACRADGSDPFLFSIFVVHFSVLIYGNYLCYRSRKISTTFSEGKYVSIAMVSNIQVLAIATPVMIIAYDLPASRLFVFSGVIFLEGLVLGSLIYIPKIMGVYKGSKVSLSSSEQNSNKYNTGTGASGSANTRFPPPSKKNTSSFNTNGFSVTKAELFSSFVEDPAPRSRTNSQTSLSSV